MRKTFLMMTLMAGISWAVPVSAWAQQGPDVGKTIPSELSASDQKGKAHTFSDLAGKNGMTLVFLRSVEWSQPCQAQATELSSLKKDFDKAGYPVVTVSYDAVDKLRAFADARKVNITMLSDPRSDIIRTFGILNTDVVKGTMAYGTPRPGVYVVGKDKVVKAKFFKDNLLERVPAKEILKSLTVAEQKAKDDNVYVIDPEAKNAPASDTAPTETLDPVAPVAPTTPVDPAAPAVETPASLPAETPASVPAMPVDPAASVAPPVTPTVESPVVDTPDMPPMPETPLQPEAAVNAVKAAVPEVPASVPAPAPAPAVPAVPEKAPAPTETTAPPSL